jgi:hypothetical protein
MEEPNSMPIEITQNLNLKSKKGETNYHASSSGRKPALTQQP